MPDIWVHGVLHRNISWEEAGRLAEEREPEPLPPEDAERLGRKMQDQAETNHALRKAGIESLDDLPVEGDDEPVDLGDFTPRDYDYEGALKNLREREAREAREAKPDKA